jgi:hypothetical protein
MDKFKLSIEEKEALIEFMASPAFKPLLRIIDEHAREQEEEVVKVPLRSEEDEATVLYAKSRGDGARKLVLNLRVYLNSLNAPKA